MGEEMAAPSRDEAVLLCQEILRIGGGASEVTFGDLARDSRVEQTFEALLGTLKAARKRGLLTFEGELLLLGQHDGATVAVLGPGAEAAAAAPQPQAEGPADADAAEGTATELAPGPAGAPSPEQAAAGGEPRAGAEAAAAGEVAATGAGGQAAPQGEEAKDPPGGRKWNVDTSYIDHRTADPDRLEGRRGSADTANTAGAGAGAATPAQSATRDKGGKWQQVDVSYINHRTSVVENLEGRRGSLLSSENLAPASTPSATVKKESDGKWKVDTSYINHRTAEVENLESRDRIASSADSAVGASAPSATVKKESDGKWKVDTSYIGYRTIDPANLTRKEEKADDIGPFADPANTKYPYEALKGMGNRPDDVDPKHKELYLSEDGFQEVFGMSHVEFVNMPKWKQQNLKKAKDIF